MIRLLQDKDYEDYVELLCQLTEISEVTKKSFENFVYIQHLVPSMIRYFVYEIDNKVVGCVSIILERKLKGNSLHIEDVVTHKEYRGKGIGVELMNYCLQYAKDNKCYKIVLDCADHNVAFYEKCGFKLSGNYMSIKL